MIMLVQDAHSERVGHVFNSLGNVETWHRQT